EYQILLVHVHGVQERLIEARLVLVGDQKYLILVCSELGGHHGDRAAGQVSYRRVSNTYGRRHVAAALRSTAPAHHVRGQEVVRSPSSSDPFPAQPYVPRQERHLCPGLCQ